LALFRFCWSGVFRYFPGCCVQVTRPFCFP